MKPLSNEIIKLESASVRMSNGDIFEFPIVDNKDLFPHLFRTTDNFKTQLQCLCIDTPIFALYKQNGGIAYLICAWEKKEEINGEALKEILSNPDMAYLLN